MLQITKHLQLDNLYRHVLQTQDKQVEIRYNNMLEIWQLEQINYLKQQPMLANLSTLPERVKVALKRRYLLETKTKRRAPK